MGMYAYTNTDSNICRFIRFSLAFIFFRLINNQVLRKIKFAVKSDVKNWVHISLR